MLSVCSGDFSLVCSLYTGTIVSTEQRLMLFNSTHATIGNIEMCVPRGVHWHKKNGWLRCCPAHFNCYCDLPATSERALYRLSWSMPVHVLHTSSLFSSFL